MDREVVTQQLYQHHIVHPDIQVRRILFRFLGPKVHQSFHVVGLGNDVTDGIQSLSRLLVPMDRRYIVWQQIHIKGLCP